jgi:bacterioferritin-associated ferredoxin
VCRCLGITEDHIVETLQTLHVRSIKDLQQVTGAGDGCTCCHEELREYIERHGCVALG